MRRVGSWLEPGAPAACSSATRPRSDWGGHLLEEFSSKVTYLCRTVKGDVKLKKHTQVRRGGGGGRPLLEEFSSKVTYLCRTVKGK